MMLGLLQIGILRKQQIGGLLYLVEHSGVRDIG